MRTLGCGGQQWAGPLTTQIRDDRVHGRLRFRPRRCGAQQCAAVGGTQNCAQCEAFLAQFCKGAEGRAAVGAERGAHPPLRPNAAGNGRIVQRLQQFIDARIAGQAFDAEGALARGRKTALHIERLGDAVRPAKARQPRRGQHDGIEFAPIELAQSGVDVAAHRQYLEVRARREQLRLTAQARGADGCALRGGIEGSVGADPGIPDILAEGDGRQHEPIVEFRGQVLHGMHGQVGIAPKQGCLEFLDEQPLAPQGAQPCIETPVALRGHGDQFDTEPRMAVLEFCLDEIRLPQRQPALARRDSQLGHRFPGSVRGGLCMPWHPAICKPIRPGIGSHAGDARPAIRYRYNSRMNADSRQIRGRLNEAPDALVERFTASVGFDRRLYRQDIRGSIAHCRMLGRVGVLSGEDVSCIVDGLQRIRAEIDAGEFVWRTDREDVHMNVEGRLIELIGETGKKLHTGRSRNDQVATDVRLYLRDEIDAILQQENTLLAALLDQAEKHRATVMPGYTHLQAAQPVTFGHHLLAWFEMLLRDRDRLLDCRARVNVLPLGAGALAGTTYPIDRQSVAEELGFDAVAGNSLDAVSDRDFAIEFCATAALTMMHFSRWCEELVMWNSQRFAFIDLPDRFCTGSSIMPQKKNPDVPELIRGKAGRVYGDLLALLTLMKSQPLAYNKDNQEDKEPLFDSVDTLGDCLEAMLGLIPNMEVRAESMRAAAVEGFATATDLADYLVRKGETFRDAHAAVGRAVAHAVEHGSSLDALSLETLRELAGPRVEADVFAVLDVDGSVAARSHDGGTAPAAVDRAIAAARNRI